MPSQNDPDDERMSEEAQKKSWNEYATLYDNSFERLSAQFAENTMTLAGFVGPIKTSQTLLDIACGPGRFAVSAAHQGFQVTATDCAENMVNYARARAKAAKVEILASVVDGQTLAGLPDAAYDVVTSYFGLTLFPNRAAGFQSVQRVLKPGGRLLLSSWSTDGFPVTVSYYTAVHAEAKELDRVDDGKPHYGKDFDEGSANKFCMAESLKKEVEAAGFRNVSLFSVNHDACFSTCKECVDLLLGNTVIKMILKVKNLESAKICMAHFVELTTQGINPLKDPNAPLPPKVADVGSAEKMPVWTKPVVVPAAAHLVIADKAA